jgi:hypothetical protein
VMTATQPFRVEPLLATSPMSASLLQSPLHILGECIIINDGAFLCYSRINIRPLIWPGQSLSLQQVVYPSIQISTMDCWRALKALGRCVCACVCVCVCVYVCVYGLIWLLALDLTQTSSHFWYGAHGKHLEQPITVNKGCNSKPSKISELLRNMSSLRKNS